MSCKMENSKLNEINLVEIMNAELNKEIFKYYVFQEIQMHFLVCLSDGLS